MEKAITTQSSAPIQQFQFTPEQVELIKKTIAVGATDNELQLFLYQAQRTGLDPLARQIYFIKRRSYDATTRGYVERGTIQTSIDGLRVVAERSGSYAGQDEPEFENKERVPHPVKCKVVVYRFSASGQRYPAGIGVAWWDEYAQLDREGNPAAMWKKMPHTMLAKVAEALALRKAFPQDLSGLYSSEEMSQADKPEVQPLTGPLPKSILEEPAILTPRQMAEAKEQAQEADPEWITADVSSEKTEDVKEMSTVTPDPLPWEVNEEETRPTGEVLANDGQRKLFFALGAELGYNAEDIKEKAKKKYNLESFTQITHKQIQPLLDAMMEQRDAKIAKRTQEARDDMDASAKDKVEVSRRVQRGELVVPLEWPIHKLTVKQARELLAQ